MASTTQSHGAPGPGPPDCHVGAANSAVATAVAVAWTRRTGTTTPCPVVVRPPCSGAPSLALAPSLAIATRALATASCPPRRARTTTLPTTSRPDHRATQSSARKVRSLFALFLPPGRAPTRPPPRLASASSHPDSHRATAHPLDDGVSVTRRRARAHICNDPA